MVYLFKDVTFEFEPANGKTKSNNGKIPDFIVATANVS